MNVDTERPRPKSSFSFRSTKSDKSASSKQKSKPLVDLSVPDSERERRRTRFSGASYADPSRAINEDQPATRALEESTLSSIRNLQHKDTYGNIITDADASNPTRPRMERPLDTIKAFEAAIDNGHRKRAQVERTETAPGSLQPAGYANRRGSWIGNDQPVNPRYNPVGGYNNGFNSYDNNSRLNSLRQASYQENFGPSGYPMPRRHQGYQRSSPAPPPLPNNQRMHSDYGIYPTHAYQDSHDTVNTNSSSEPWAYSTDPSSENSSVDRVQAANMKQDYNDAYGGVHPGQPPYGRGSPRSAPIMEEQAHYDHGYPAQRQEQYRASGSNPSRSQQHYQQQLYSQQLQQQQQQPPPTNDRPPMPLPQSPGADPYASQQFPSDRHANQQLPPPPRPQQQYYQPPMQSSDPRSPMRLDKPQPPPPPQQQQFQGSPLSPTRSRPMWPNGAPPAPSAGARYNNQRPGNRLQRTPSSQQQQGSKDKGEKRKSWFKRTFSKD